MMTSTVWNNTPLPKMQTACRIDRVLLMDACPITRAGICSAFQPPQFQVMDCVHVEKVCDLPVAMQQGKVDVVITELCGEGESVLEGLRMISHLRQYWARVPLIVATSLQEPHLLAQLRTLRVSGIYLKQDPLSSLTQGVLCAMAGLSSLSPSAVNLVGNGAPSLSLTGREMDVLECLFAGRTVTDTARVLARDVRTISTHKRRAMIKLGFHSDSDLYTRGDYLARNGLLI
ncbi:MULTISPECIES: response regulator transcription factor [Serratia]|uniref:response regulator transcription factor n=1 Tax=Serratia TaxID=613 RepID=UPI000EF547CA|nr:MULTISPECIES: response regulator transcription factor [Serratia]AYM93518.1 DNA-binding response regulator [Serratia sp. 3ACOL1]MDK2377479.1 response regulator transcription factor [Serratia fonticola]